MRYGLKNEYRDSCIDYCGGLQGKDFDIGRIDVGARKLVQFLRDHNFMTHSSCQGGPGHWERFLSVDIKTNDIEKERQRLYNVLRQNYQKNFYIYVVYVTDNWVDAEERRPYVEEKPYLKLEMVGGFTA